MNWKEFFKIEIKSQGQTFFKAKLPLKTQFQSEDLILDSFEHFQLSSSELKSLSLDQRKILLRHCVFQTEHFQRISQQFLHKILHHKGALEFSTEGAGVYVFLKALQLHCSAPLKISCQTTEIPFAIYPELSQSQMALQLILQPQPQTYLGNLPSLWKDSWTLNLFEIDDAEDQVA
jgi:hypothetical protein